MSSVQRRAGKSQAHISAPLPQGTNGAGSDPEKVSRLNQRNFGVTNRIWLIVSLFLVILLLTHFLLSASHPPTVHQPSFSRTHVKPKNYFNATDVGPNPFEFCPVYGPGDDLGEKYGAFTLSQSRLHLGSGARIQRFIHKALKGHPVTISILGGSVSSCHGAGDDPISPQCYPSRFFEWWNTVFPQPASELTNGAMRRTSSEYFGFCSAHHLPDITDLVILELDSDDSPDRQTLENFELLVRSLLIRPDQPAILVLGHFSPQVHSTTGFAGPEHWHNIVAQFYDVPHISTKPALYGDYITNPSSINRYYADPVLANPAGHEIIADILVGYFQLQICNAWSVISGKSYEAIIDEVLDVPETHGIFGGVGQRKGPAPQAHEVGDIVDNRLPVELVAPAPAAQARVPAARINTKATDTHPFVEVAPYCVSANDLINPVPPSLFYGSGWTAVHPTGGPAPLNINEYYWSATMPGSKLRIPLQVGAGDIGIYYLREPMREIGEGSAIECWVDDNYAGSTVIENSADVGEVTPSLEVIDRFVTRGSHFVECQLLGEEGDVMPSFKMLGILAT